jgi:hypothetical protein
MLRIICALLLFTTIVKAEPIPYEQLLAQDAATNRSHQVENDVPYSEQADGPEDPGYTIIRDEGGAEQQPVERDLILNTTDAFFVNQGFIGPSALRNSGINQTALLRSFSFLRSNWNIIRNRNYLAIVDFTLSDQNKRFFLINLLSGEVKSFMVAHGLGSGRGDYVERVSSVPGSNSSSAGPYLTGDIYRSKKPGIRIRLNGLARSNATAARRAILVHGANYVSEEYGVTGHSEGCFALSWENYSYVIRKITGRGLLYAYYQR